MKNQKGQVILILVLVMTVALAIGISVVQRSISDISTASKVEQSSRAFSAAEAGIEKAIQANTAIASPIPLNNNSTIQDVQKNDIPATNRALEYPLLAKEDLAQVWLAKPDDLTSPYTGSTLGIYWGNVGTTGADKPAIEITVIYQDISNAYKSKKYFYDQDASTRNNGFDSSVTCPSDAISTSLSPAPQTKTFLCKKSIDVSSSNICGSATCLSKLILLRARLLYSSASQAFAVSPASGFSLPAQARLFTATGVSGQTQRKVQVFRLDKVVPTYFDYAIFSAGDISKE